MKTKRETSKRRKKLRKVRELYEKKGEMWKRGKINPG